MTVAESRVGDGGALPALSGPAGATALQRAWLEGPSAVYLTDPSGVILDVNRAFLDTYGYQRADVVGRNASLLRSGRDQAVIQGMWEAIRDPARGLWSGEIVNRRRDGSELVVALSVVALRTASGEVEGYLATSTDVTRHREAERLLAEKNRELEELGRLQSQLVALASHDLKSPLSAVSGYAALLREELPAGELRDMAEGIARLVRGALQRIDSLVDLERLNSGTLRLSPTRLALDAVLRAVLEAQRPAAAARRVDLRLRPGNAPPRLVGDRGKLEQALAHLVASAIRLTPPGTAVEVGCRQEGSRTIVEVDDQGPAIPEAHLEEIFDAYYSVRQRAAGTERGFGAGVGLAVARALAELHGGRLAAENLEPAGCRFRLTLPARGLAPSAGALACLFVDPTGSLAPALAPPLRRRGVELFTAKSLDEAAPILGHEVPELVFLHPSALAGDAPHPFASREPGAPLAVVVGASRPGLRHLEPPVADVEVLALLREVAAAGGPR